MAIYTQVIDYLNHRYILGDDEFSEWENWGACNVTCGEGTRQRSRYCKIVPTYPPSGDPYCTLPTEQFIACYNEPCVGEDMICFQNYICLVD